MSTAAGRLAIHAQHARIPLYNDDDDTPPPPSVPSGAQWMHSLGRRNDRIPRIAPYTLRGASYPSSLRLLEPHHLWIDHDATRFNHELMVKRRLLAMGSPWRDTVYQAQTGSDAVQKEVLTFVLNYIRTAYPDEYVERAPGEITIVATGDTYNVNEWQDSPLILASLLVQEDLLVLLPGETEYCFVAGTACFSFTDTPLNGAQGYMRLGQPIDIIHTVVPGFKGQKLGSVVSSVLKGIKTGRPFWRANWGLEASPWLSPFEPEMLHGEPAFTYGKNQTTPLNGYTPEELYLRVEYQTLHRLPQTGAVLFVLHTYVVSLMDLVGPAAHAFGLAIGSMTDTQRRYRGVTEDLQRDVCQYLHDKA